MYPTLLIFKLLNRMAVSLKSSFNFEVVAMADISKIT